MEMLSQLSWFSRLFRLRVGGWGTELTDQTVLTDITINMKNRSQKLGRSGEEIAVKYLINMGYKMIDRNFRVPGGEIDVVAKDNGILVFVEVKNYSYRNFYMPVYSISLKKKMRIRRTAEEYLYRNDIQNNDCRFDVVLIYMNEDGRREIELIQDVFL